ncbi:hypothetical protein Clacol_005577 [Clathrus columnatus]|uniref:Uncharacterized protein n=1 Tax=Clathrus columnatus TaxID=1419009 RepID=A0AAV5AEM3_9AGAM|nr:hypothetical protein Clacol_005577 [Clathrus columnatus]
MTLKASDHRPVKSSKVEDMQSRHLYKCLSIIFLTLDIFEMDRLATSLSNWYLWVERRKQADPEPSASSTAVTHFSSNSSDTKYLPVDDLHRTLIELENNGEIPKWESSDEETDSEEGEYDEEAEVEIQDDSTFLIFVGRLREAQNLLQRKEKETEALQKRPKTYQKNSARTTWWHVQKQWKLKENNPNFKFLTDYFPKSVPEKKQNLEVLEILSDKESGDGESESSCSE